MGAGALVAGFAVDLGSGAGAGLGADAGVDRELGGAVGADVDSVERIAATAPAAAAATTCSGREFAVAGVDEEPGGFGVVACEMGAAGEAGDAFAAAASAREAGALAIVAGAGDEAAAGETGAAAGPARGGRVVAGLNSGESGAGRGSGAARDAVLALADESFSTGAEGAELDPKGGLGGAEVDTGGRGAVGCVRGFGAKTGAGWEFTAGCGAEAAAVPDGEVRTGDGAGREPGLPEAIGERFGTAGRLGPGVAGDTARGSGAANDAVLAFAVSAGVDAESGAVAGEAAEGVGAFVAGSAGKDRGRACATLSGAGRGCVTTRRGRAGTEAMLSAVWGASGLIGVGPTGVGDVSGGSAGGGLEAFDSADGESEGAIGERWVSGLSATTGGATGSG